MRAAIFILAASGACHAAAPIDITIYADENFPPYSYVKDNKISGIYTHILQTAFARMPEFKVSIVPAPWKRILRGISAGDYFAFYPPYKLPKERPFIDPYSVDILAEQVIPICTAKIMQTPRKKFPEDYSGLTFANNTGFVIGGDAFWAAVHQGKIHIEEAPSTEQNLKKLAYERVDCYINDQLAIRHTLSRLLKNKSIPPAIRLIEGPVATHEYGHVGYSRSAALFPYKAQFIRALDNTLTTMKKNGEINLLVTQFFESQEKE